MNTNHYPDEDRCYRLSLLGFPRTDKINGFFTDGKPFICPSIAEMLDVIPHKITIDDFYTFRLIIEPDYYSSFFNAWACYYMRPSDNQRIKEDLLVFCSHTPLPNALAELIIWLHENNYIKF